MPVWPRATPQAISRKTNQLMEMVDLDPAEYLDRYPTELSGGQQQRIGVIRALANDPEVVLSTSPSLRLIRSPGAACRTSWSQCTKRWENHGFVTHDMDEAIKIADRICIMRNGHILQFDTPEQILKHPPTISSPVLSAPNGSGTPRSSSVCLTS